MKSHRQITQAIRTLDREALECEAMKQLAPSDRLQLGEVYRNAANTLRWVIGLPLEEDPASLATLLGESNEEVDESGPSDQYSAN